VVVVVVVVVVVGMGVQAAPRARTIAAPA
jgi:hypothetical protein